MVFKTTPAKDIIRVSVDKTIIADFQKRAGCKLSYFGLPGGLMLDILCWKELLRHFAAVERDQDLIEHRLLSTAFKRNIDRELELLRGDIDEVMSKWKDVDGRVPSLRSYDVLNLDYEGGMMYKDLQGSSRRLAAIRQMIQRQANEKQDFLLLMTVNTRNRDSKEFDNALQDIQDQLSEYGIDASEVVDWYKGQGYHYKLKVYVPYVFDSIAGSSRYVVRYHPPVTYLGSSSRRMVHFVMQMEYDETRAGRLKSRSLLQVMNIPFYEIAKSRLVELPIKTLTLSS